MKKLLLVLALLAVAAFSTTSNANAGVVVGFNIGGPGYYPGYYNPYGPYGYPYGYYGGPTIYFGPGY